MNSYKPKISFIIPVYNGEKTLAPCLESVLDQDFSDFEVIVVDNNSNDKTKEIIMSFLERSDKFSYVFESKRGRANARNAGISVVNGEIIAMIDADCIAPPDWLNKILEPIIKGNELVVSGFEKDAIGNYWSRMRQTADWRFTESKVYNGYINHLDTKNFAIKADILKRFRFNSELLTGEDWDLYLRLRKENIRIKFLPELLVEHCHDSSFLELFSNQFIRGKCLVLILDTYQNDLQIKQIFKDDESANSYKIMNFILFIPWVFWQFISKPIQALYNVTADLAWKCGIISGLFKIWASHYLTIF